MTIYIDNGGILRNFGGLVIESGDMFVGDDGRLESRVCGTAFGKDLYVRNHGWMFFCVAGESTLLQGHMENQGILSLAASSRLVIDTPSGAKNLACLNNQGEVQAWDSPDCYIWIKNGEFIGNDVIGNALVYGDD